MRKIGKNFDLIYNLCLIIMDTLPERIAQKSIDSEVPSRLNSIQEIIPPRISLKRKTLRTMDLEMPRSRCQDRDAQIEMPRSIYPFWSIVLWRTSSFFRESVRTLHSLIQTEESLERNKYGRRNSSKLSRNMSVSFYISER